MNPPPRDDAGNVRPHDHPQITNHDIVIRRISIHQTSVDKKTGQRRISSLAFKPSSEPNGSLSVDIERLIRQAGLEPEIFVTTPRWMGSLKYSTGDLRAENFLVGFDPIAENPFHGGVWGEFTDLQRDKLREKANWFIEIDGVQLRAASS